jgi:hypothetical protein
MAAAVLYGLSAGSGFADEGTKVDCSQIDMKFSAQGYEAK